MHEHFKSTSLNQAIGARCETFAVYFARRVRPRVRRIIDQRHHLGCDLFAESVSKQTAALHHGLTPAGLAWAAFASLLIAQFFIDFDTQLLPDDLNYLILWGGLLAALLQVTQVPISTPATVTGVSFSPVTKDLVVEVEGGSSVPLTEIRRVDG
jgi:hypothetical protein